MKASPLASKQNAEAQQSRNAAGWLGLAASPTFALMAWISASDVQAMMCSSTTGGFPIDGMALMYLLMSFFHLSPWLRLTSSRQWHLTYPATHNQGG